MEHIQGTLPDGEELVLVDEADADAIYERQDPRGTSLRLRRDALGPQRPAASIPTGR